MNSRTVTAAPAQSPRVAPADGTDYELLDSGRGAKLERFGRYTFVRPEPEALWRPALPDQRWHAADGVFKPKAEGDKK